MTSCQWAAAVTALAISFAQDKTCDELAFWGALFSQLGDTLSLLAVEPPKGC